ncbi:hypothetical protein AO498_06050 [Algoriphagus sanaruensis]|uniref:Uncharacterized protein n=1 Tax=Algoriphagus sanaruensis TaxID=1727163 RepID=A0A142ELG2_9BACT|nr:hypothetical protein AO498_06050 [Algoriphagus sanaruensis]
MLWYGLGYSWRIKLKFFRLILAFLSSRESAKRGFFHQWSHNLDEESYFRLHLIFESYVYK